MTLAPQWVLFQVMATPLSIHVPTNTPGEAVGDRLSFWMLVFMWETQKEAPGGLKSNHDEYL